MSERLPRNTHWAHRLDRARGAAAVAAVAGPARLSVAERAARLSVAASAPATDSRGPIGPAGTGPSIDEVRESIRAGVRTLVRESLAALDAPPAGPPRPPRRRRSAPSSPQLRLPGIDGGAGPYGRGRR